MMPSWITHADLLSQTLAAGSLWQQTSGQHIAVPAQAWGGWGNQRSMRAWPGRAVCAGQGARGCRAVWQAGVGAAHVRGLVQWRAEGHTLALASATAMEPNPPARGMSLRTSLRVVLYPPGSGTSSFSHGTGAGLLSGAAGSSCRVGRACT